VMGNGRFFRHGWRGHPVKYIVYTELFPMILESPVFYTG
jgi:hypothetical protein